MSADPQLARVPEVFGASPLYLAVSLGLYNVARQLHDKDEGLSYCGPRGRNVMHAAVLHPNTRELYTVLGFFFITWIQISTSQERT
jgi:hypothetical protein